jgi:transcriptional regulator GlxA family with amidase domain
MKSLKCRKIELKHWTNMCRSAAKRLGATNLENIVVRNPEGMQVESKNISPLVLGPARAIYFYVLPEFSMLSLCSAIEPLRMANEIAQQQLYSWRFLGDGASALESSIGIPLAVDDDLPAVVRNDIVFVCAGVNVQLGTTKRLLNWIRKCARTGASIGGLCTGAYVLAKAGLLKGKRATIHWNVQHSLDEMFPETLLTQTPIQIDGNRMTTAGGVASIDLMLELIERHHEARLSNRVAEQLMYSNIQIVQKTTSITAADRKRTISPKLKRVIRVMEENLERPLKGARLAYHVNLSTRQLERLFHKFFNQSPIRYYNGLRLQRAYDLLLHTDMTLIDIAFACGFGSASSFSKNFQKKFGVSPHQTRQKHLRY